MPRTFHSRSFGPVLPAAPPADYPGVGDVRAEVVYDLGALTGTLELPAVEDVRAGVTYGAGGDEFTGGLVPEVGPPPTPVGGSLEGAILDALVAVIGGLGLTFGGVPLTVKASKVLLVGQDTPEPAIKIVLDSESVSGARWSCGGAAPRRMWSYPFRVGISTPGNRTEVKNLGEITAIREAITAALSEPAQLQALVPEPIYDLSTDSPAGFRNEDWMKNFDILLLRLRVQIIRDSPAPAQPVTNGRETAHV